MSLQNCGTTYQTARRHILKIWILRTALWERHISHVIRTIQQTSNPPVSVCAECPIFGPMHMVAAHLVMFISCWMLPRMRNVSDKSCREIQNTHLSSVTPFRKSCLLWDNVEQCDTTQKRYILCIRGKNRHTFVISNTCCCSTATVVMRTRFNLRLCVHFLSGSIWTQQQATSRSWRKKAIAHSSHPYDLSAFS